VPPPAFLAEGVGASLGVVADTALACVVSVGGVPVGEGLLGPLRLGGAVRSPVVALALVTRSRRGMVLSPPLAAVFRGVNHLFSCVLGRHHGREESVIQSVLHAVEPTGQVEAVLLNEELVDGSQYPHCLMCGFR
jgi:hypothetical protein